MPVRHAIAAGIGKCVFILGVILLLSVAGPARAQCPAAWVPGIGTPWTNGSIYAVAVLPGGDVIVGGQFNIAGGVAASNIARYSPVSGVWSSLGLGINGYVGALAVLPSGDLIVGGFFTASAGGTVSNIARFNPVTGAWTRLGTGTNSAVNALAVLPSGDIVVGGYFTNAGGVAANYLARYSSTGTWSAVGGGPGTYVNAVVPVLGRGASFDSYVFAGGGFDSFGGGAALCLLDSNFPAPGQNAVGVVNGGINALCVLPNGDVIVGGEFNTVPPGFPANYIARWNPNGWSLFGSGTNNTINALAVLPGGDVVVGGAFSTAGGVTANNIARLNPATGSWTSMGAGTNAPVYALAVLPGGDVIAGGGFTSAGGIVSNKIARFFPGTSAPIITTHPLSLAVGPLSNAVFYVGAVAGVGSSGAPTYQWRKDGVAISQAAVPSAVTPVLQLTSIQTSDLGSYDCLVTNSCGGVGAISNSAALTLAGQVATPPCSVADVVGGGPDGLDPDGVIDGSDFVAFINAFALGC